MFRGLPRAGLTPGRDEDGELVDKPSDAQPTGHGEARATTEARPEFTSALAAELLAQRTAALQAQVADRPGLALRLVVQSLLLERGYGGSAAVTKIAGRAPCLKQACPTIEDTVAGRALADLHERRGDHEPGQHVEILPWLLTLDDSEVLGILAPLVASTVAAGTEDWSRGAGVSLAAQAAQAAELDMTEYWVATPETYFRRVSKAQIAQAVSEAGAGLFSLDGKKADVAAAAARVIAGTGWLPSLLRMPPPEDEAADAVKMAAE